uniref:Sema domain-containing protein n=1 Tax=Anisakis simplex TaxID=6269 RepID=A0A0M3KJA8_ANISI
LGLNVSSTCRPTISYVLRNPNTELVYCYAGSTYSAVLTAEGQCIASGVLPWQSERQNEFQSSLNPVFANHTIQFFDKGIVAVQTYTRLTKMLLLKSSIATDYQRSQTIYSIFFKNSDGDHFIRLKFIIAKQSQTQHCPIQTNLSNIQLSSHGEFIAMDEVEYSIDCHL